MQCISIGFGPESYEDYVGVYPDDNFWEIVEYMECPENLETNYPQEEIDDALGRVCATEDKIDSLIAKNKIPAEDRDMIIDEQKMRRELFSNRATYVSWQLVVMLAIMRSS